MPTMKLTKTAIAGLPAPHPGGSTIYWDQGLRGFGVLCSGKTTTKSFVVQRAVNGRKRRVSLGTVAEYDHAGKTIEEARTAAAGALLDMRSGKDPKAKAANDDVTLRSALDRYLRARPNLGERTRDSYRVVVERWFSRWLDRPLREIAPDMLEARHRAIKDEVAAERRRATDRRRRRAERRGEEPPAETDLFVSEAGAGAANGAFRVLRAVWNFARAWSSEVPPWPTERLRGQWFRLGRRERRVAASDLPAFYAAVNEVDDGGEYALGRVVRDYIVLLLFTGMRRREAAGLRWKDVDLPARVIRLPAKATKAKRRLDLPMSDVVHDLLVARNAIGTEGEWIFPGPGRSGHLEEPKRAFAQVAAATGVVASPHALRATFITVASDVPMSAYALKGLVNHALGDDVTAGCVQLTTEALRGPAQAVADMLKVYCGIAAQEGESVEAPHTAGMD